MPQGFLLPNLSRPDTIISSDNIDLLRKYIKSRDRSLVFFVGAGASSSGNTGMPSTPSLLYHLLLQALSSSGKFDLDHDELKAVLVKISSKIGFEITLNDFWQICRQAITRFYDGFAAIETKCRPNRVHNFLAYWLSSGGTVITTNYDRLIERDWIASGQSINTRYQETGENSFIKWKRDLLQGGCLFKIHGSLDAPESCLGALEHVGTQLSGNRSDFLSEILLNRPLCFVGWKGVDPDIPPLLHQAFAQRDPSLFSFWFHYEGASDTPASLADQIRNSPSLVKAYAEKNPILTDADRAFEEMLNWMGLASKPNPELQPYSPDFSKSIDECSSSGATRMVGIILRRAGEFDPAARVLHAALDLAITPGERSAALQELSLLQQQRDGIQIDKASKFLSKAFDALKGHDDLHLRANADLGMLSMSVVNLGSRPWLLLRLPTLFYRYQRDIKSLREKTSDAASVALHVSLLNLFLGRLRLKFLGQTLGTIPIIADWILRPYNEARSTIDDAKDIHIPSRIDVLAYRAVALAHLNQCSDAFVDVPEVNRLIPILNDNARAKYWEKQREDIEKRCAGYH